MARVVVLGGTQFLGPPIVQQLVEGGHDVTVFHRGEQEPASTAHAEHVHGDFSELAHFIPRLLQRRPDVVLDTVPYIDKCGHGIRHFVGAVDRAVVVTSLDVYRAFAILWGTEDEGLEQSMPVDEDAATRSGPAPDLTPDIDFDNLEVERALTGSAALAVTVLRLPMIYGARDPQRRLSRYVRRMDDGRPAIVLDETLARLRWSRGCVENVAAAVVLAVTDERAAGRTYNVAEPGARTEAEWVESIGKVCNWDGRIVVVPPGRLPSALRVPIRPGQDLYANTERLRRELGYVEPVAVSEGLRRAVEWERAQQADEASPDYSDEDRVLNSLPPRQ